MPPMPSKKHWEHGHMLHAAWLFTETVQDFQVCHLNSKQTGKQGACLDTSFLVKSCCQDLAGIPEVPEGMGKASSLPKCWRRWQMRQLFALLRGSSKAGGRRKMGMFAADNMDLMLLTSSLCGSGLFIYPKHRLCKHFFENCSRNSGCFWCFTLCCSPCLLAGRCGQKLPLGRKGRFGSDVHQDQSLSREAAVEEMQSCGWPDSSC